MKSEAKLLYLICVLSALALTSMSFLTTDNLFVTMICLLMALMFAVNPLLYLKDEGRLPIPFLKRDASPAPASAAGRSLASPAASSPPLLDAKGRAVPPDVKSMVANMQQKQPTPWGDS
jgi:hypothetical protein